MDRGRVHPPLSIIHAIGFYNEKYEEAHTVIQGYDTAAQ